MASLESRSVSNLIEVMADERWKGLAEQQGVAYAKTVAEAMKSRDGTGGGVGAGGGDARRLVVRLVVRLVLRPVRHRRRGIRLGVPGVCGGRLRRRRRLFAQQAVERGEVRGDPGHILRNRGEVGGHPGDHGAMRFGHAVMVSATVRSG